MNKKILVVDDEQSIREFFQILFRRIATQTKDYVFDVTVAETGDKALKLLRKQSFDMVISDLKMPGMSGIQLLQSAKSIRPDIIFLLITAFDTTQTAVKAMKMGALDYIPKPFNVEKVKELILSALKVQHKGKEKDLSDTSRFVEGRSPSMQKLLREIKQLAVSSSNVLITGESGTGKEMVARFLHAHSALKDQAFVAVNCGAIPNTLIESEMFGHKKGSFTGAVADKKGFFEVADGGALFLDEIGELPLMVQPKLLRALQEKTIRMVGAVADKKVQVRLISATNRDLESMVQDRQFREDLFYRLNVIRLRIPPLRERIEDISFFAQYFLKKHSQKLKIPLKTLSKKALALLETYSYPGNVRELENLMERVMVLSEGAEITDKDLAGFLGPSGGGDGKKGPSAGALKVTLPEGGMDLPALIDSLEKSLLEQALEKTEGAKQPAADLLRLSLRAFRYRLRKYNLAQDGHDF